jgi:signal transduction histidine kinase/FixJ family two-component response regulator/streptogramin lyase
VFDALRDREGGLWFATTDGGVAYLRPNWSNFALARHDPGNAHSLSDNRVTGLASDALGRLWSVNLVGGIDVLQPRTGSVTRLAQFLPVPDKALWSVLADRAGRLWVGHAHGLRVYEMRNGQFRDVPVDAKDSRSLAPGFVDLLVEAQDGAIWASANGGAVHRIESSTLSVGRFDAASGLRSTDIAQLGFAPDGTLLAASAAGLDRFDSGARRFIAVTGAPLQRVLAFAFAPGGSLWLHTSGSLAQFRYDWGSLSKLSEPVGVGDGWPSLTAGGMQVDSGGRIWVSSPRGLWRFDPATRRTRRFAGGDGMASAEFNRLPMLQTHADIIFGATLAGIVGFEPARIVESSVSVPPLLDTISVRRDGDEIPFDAKAQDIVLRWDDRDLRFAMRALSYADPGSVRYQSRLKGFDRAWINAGAHGEREFSQLPAGNYRLDLRVAGADGVWSASNASLRLHVGAAPWATPAAYIAYASAVSLMLLQGFRTYRARVRRALLLELAERQRRFAEDASAAKTEFLATMGHEIRTPMTGVLGMTELLLRTPLADDQLGYAQAIQSSGQMMLRLVNDALDLARIEAGKLTLESRPFDLHELMQQIDALSGPLARAKGLAWAMTVAADAPRHVAGDAMRVKQVAMNLVNNAIKFTSAGSVSLTLARGDIASVQFDVRDTGPGIGPDEQQRLYRRFEQVDGPQRHAGSGLGLAICLELVARMGGRISLESARGEGARFRVDLPLAETIIGDFAGTTPPSPGAIRRILLVEDDAVVAAVIVGLLTANGHSVCHVRNALVAMTELAAATYDVVMIDLDLPGVDGLALARMIRCRMKTHMPLIGISARSTGDEQAQCQQAGMQAFLRKPICAAVLERCLREHVDAASCSAAETQADPVVKNAVQKTLTDA